MEFNTKQETINNEQKKFNDASRVLAMQSQIMQLDENIRFGYSTTEKTHEGKGSSSLKLLQRGTPARVTIPYEVLVSLIEKVHMLDASVCSLVNVTKKSSLSEEEKKSTLSIALVFLSNILDFYGMVRDGGIEYLLPINNLGKELIGLPNAQQELEDKINNYSPKVKSTKEACDKIISA